MRSAWVVLGLCLVVAASVKPTNAFDEREILPRASDGSSATPPLSTASASGPISTVITSGHALSSTDALSSSPTPLQVKSTGAQSGLTSDISAVATSSHSLSPSSSYGTSTPSVTQAIYSANGTVADQLPIKPAINPALSIAGAILILTGVVYTLIGIRTKWLHIFLSSAYLVSLAVTVLIIYVMHPPIRNAIQGAYFVAAFVIGVVFGIGSVIFADLTECLGCLLGGFCLDLNDDLFPPHYSGPYPVTRGIQVEIAAIVLLFLVGVMSQLKVWKIVKKRREQKEAYRLEEQGRQEQDELDLGRRLEEGNIQEKIRWEAAYGDGRRKHVDSGLGTDATNTPGKDSISDHEQGSSKNRSMEYAAVKGVSKDERQAQSPTRITVRVASDDSIYELPSSTSEDLLYAQRQEHSALEEGSGRAEARRKSNSYASSMASAEGPSARSGEIPQLSPGPEVTPLPFKPITSQTSEDDDRSSIATFAASDRLPSRMSQRLSEHSLLESLSRRSKPNSNRLAHAKDTSPHDDDRASSIAATIDDIGDGTSSRGDVSELGVDATPSDEDGHDASEKLLSGGNVALLTFDNLNADDRVPSGGDSTSTGATKQYTKLDNDGVVEEGDIDRGRGYLEQSLKPTSSPPPPIPERSPSRASAPSPKASHEHLSPSTLRNQLPDGASKVVMAYRTNEWAKHLEQAEVPAFDDLRRHAKSSDAAATTTEAAVPVHVQALQQTPLTAEPAHMSIKQKPTPQELNLNRSNSPRDSLPSQQKYAKQSTKLRRSSMGRVLDHSSSQTSLSRRTKHRSSSTPMNTSPLAESPIEEDVEMSFPKRTSAHPTNGIMAQRSHKLETRYSSTSLAHANSYNSFIAPCNPHDLHQNPRRSSRPDLTPRTSATLTTATNPPQNRTSFAANWRSSMKQDPRASNQALSNELEGKRSDLLMQQRRASAAEQERVQRADAEKGARVSREDFLEAHQRAMRKLQGSVKH